MCACVHPKRSPVFQSPRPASRCSSYLPSLYLVRFPDRSAARPDPNQIRPLFPAQICAPNPTPASHPPPPLYPSSVAHILQSENRQLFPPSPIACTALVNYVVPPSQMQPVSGDHRLQLTRLSNFPATRGRCRNSHARQPHCLAASRWPHMYLYSQPHPSTADHPGPSFQKIQLPAHRLKHNNLEAISTETEQH